MLFTAEEEPRKFYFLKRLGADPGSGWKFINILEGSFPSNFPKKILKKGPFSSPFKFLKFRPKKAILGLNFKNLKGPENGPFFKIFFSILAG